jgi:hypothetical protein
MTNRQMNETDNEAVEPKFTGDEPTSRKLLKLGGVCLICLSLAGVLALLIQFIIS